MEVSGTRYAVFLFETMLLCCLDGAGDRRPARYPTKPWELGPGLREKSLLNLVHAIPTTSLSVLRITGYQSFTVEWRDSTPWNQYDLHRSERAMVLDIGDLRCVHR